MLRKFKGAERVAVAIILMQLITMGAVGISPALAQIGAAFPDRSTEEIQLLMSLPSLATIFSSLFTTVVSDKLGKKNTVILGIVIFLVTGLVPVFASQWAIVVASRIGIGLGCGLVNTLNNVLVFDHFDDVDQQNSLLGWTHIGNDLGYVIMAMAAGYLTLISWQTVFLVHAVGIIALLVVIFCLPNDRAVRPVGEATRATDVKPAGRRHITGAAVFWVVVMLFFEGTLHTFSMNISYLVEESGAGGSVLAGYASTMMTVGGFFISLFYGKIASVLKRWTFAVGVLIDVMAMFILYSVRSDTGTLAVVGGTMIGIGMVMVFSSGISFVMRSLNPATAAIGSTMFMVAINGSQFLNTYWAAFLTNTFADGSFAGRFLCAGIVLAIVMIIGAFTAEKVGCDCPQD